MKKIPFAESPITLYTSKHATTFIHRMITNLFQIDRASEQITYEFYLPDTTTAYALYERIHNEMLDKLALENEALPDRFKQLNATRLKLHVVDEMRCAFPTVVLNHGTADSSWGFIFFVENAKIVSLAEIHNVNIRSWYQNYYLRAKFSRKTVTFEEYLAKAC